MAKRYCSMNSSKVRQCWLDGVLFIACSYTLWRDSFLDPLIMSGLTASHKSVGAILDRPLSHEPASMPESCTCDQADISENLKVGCIQNVHLYQCFCLGL